jgi:hypothetical protein
MKVKPSLGGLPGGTPADGDVHARAPTCTTSTSTSTRSLYIGCDAAPAAGVA